MSHSNGIYPCQVLYDNNNWTCGSTNINAGNIELFDILPFSVPEYTTQNPTGSSQLPTAIPTEQPSKTPSHSPFESTNSTPNPTDEPSATPSQFPSQSTNPTSNPTKQPSQTPSQFPSRSANPTLTPTFSPTLTFSPTQLPTNIFIVSTTLQQTRSLNNVLGLLIIIVSIIIILILIIIIIFLIGNMLRKNKSKKDRLHIKNALNNDNETTHGNITPCSDDIRHNKIIGENALSTIPCESVINAQIINDPDIAKNEQNNELHIKNITSGNTNKNKTRDSMPVINTSTKYVN